MIFHHYNCFYTFVLRNLSIYLSIYHLSTFGTLTGVKIQIENLPCLILKYDKNNNEEKPIVSIDH